MRAEIISIGTELLLGQITNTNAQFISEQLAMLGIPVYYHSVVGDNPSRIQTQLEISSKRSDILIFTGGLGPTKDDLTKETIARYLGRTLELHLEAMEQIRNFFSKRNIIMTPNNERQAMVIEGCILFPNYHGLAPGMAVEVNTKHYLLFPGPPKELQPMFTQYAVPYLMQLLPENKVVHSRVLRFCGIGESTLETQLQDLIDQQTNPTIAPLAKEGEVTLRVTSFADDVTQAELIMEPVIQQIRNRVGEYLYGYDQDTLQSVVVHLLNQKKWTLSIAESCTGGLLSHYISQVSGASEVFQGGLVCYSVQMKQQLGVPTATLEKAGAVSQESATYLAERVKDQYVTDVGVSITGVAGPTEQEGKPIGLVYIGFSLPTGSFVREVNLVGSREAIQDRAAKLAMTYLINELKKGE